MRYLDSQTVEEMLEGKISKNPNRFEEANGIVFSVNNMDENVMNYLSMRGIEFHELVNGIYYTETVMSVVEFGNLDYILYTLKIA